VFDAVITAAAMVARADGLIDPVERRQLLVFLNRTGLLAVFTREQALDAFEERTRQLAERRGAEVAIGSLRRLKGRSLARLVIDAGTRRSQSRMTVFTPVSCTCWRSSASRSQARQYRPSLLSLS
jgi:tellurite resistance protein